MGFYFIFENGIHCLLDFNDDNFNFIFARDFFFFLKLYNKEQGG